MRKAQKEILSTGRHRGLVEIVPDIVLAEKHLRKAEHNLLAAIEFEVRGFSDWSVSAVFYCLYHCLLAIITKHGFESGNQECTLALVKYLKAKGSVKVNDCVIEAINSASGSYGDGILGLRENYQYGVETEICDTSLSYMKEICKIAIEGTKSEIFPSTHT